MTSQVYIPPWELVMEFANERALSSYDRALLQNYARKDEDPLSDNYHADISVGGGKYWIGVFETPDLGEERDFPLREVDGRLPDDIDVETSIPELKEFRSEI